MPGKIRLPHLQALAIFEAAARHLNFTAAAGELGSSQPAVSQRINQLEHQLGTKLFDRGHRGVMLTEIGEQLYHIVHSSLQEISLQLDKIQQKKTRSVLRIDTDMGFASFWLLPRLGLLQAVVPNVDVQISTSPNAFSLRDSNAHLAISFGDGYSPGCGSDLLFPEVVIPVCSPEFARRQQLTGSAQSLLGQSLLNLPDLRPARWLNWAQWFSEQQLVAGEGVTSVTFNAYSLVVQAAIKGQGVALGWRPLIDEFLTSGELVTCGPEVKTGQGYYLIQPEQEQQNSIYNTVKKWLIGEAFSFATVGESAAQVQII